MAGFFLSARFEYAIWGLVELALSDKKQPLRAREIAIRYRIPEKYLIQVFGELREKGWILSVKGRNGGYVLNADPDQIRFSDICAILEPAFKGSSGPSVSYPGMGTACPLKKVFDGVRTAVQDELAKTTLAGFIRGLEREERYMYYI